MYRKYPDYTDDVFASWAQGYITGMNVGMVAIGVYFDMGTKSFDEMRHFLRKYCNDHPLANFGNATVELANSLPRLKYKDNTPAPR
jgi:hypothetical protein